MENYNDYIDILIEACKSSLEQMTRFTVNHVEKQMVLKEEGAFPFAHIIGYKDDDKKIDGEFVLGFGSVNDALKLASAISERLGIGKIEKIGEDSTDLLNEFLNIVVGRTISDWDNLGFSVNFDTPVFKQNYEGRGSKKLKGYILRMEIASDTLNLEEERSSDEILLRVNFVEKVKNKIRDKVILIAEDSKVMRTIISKMLKENGAEVKEVGDGEEAIAAHRKYKPDLTLMDINMPKLNGLEAIAQIKKNDPGAKFIILSSSSRKDEIITAKTLNVSGYLVKPVEHKQLIERVSALF